MTSSDDSSTMLAFCVNKQGGGQVKTVPKPTTIPPNFALIRVLRAGVCNTDLEILQGYMGFEGVLGHEFVGIVEQVNDGSNRSTVTGTDSEWVGKRVCGDINVGCHQQECFVCQGALDDDCCQMSRNHCPKRTVLGILNHHGTMAEYLTLPITNLHVVPDDMSDQVAVFAEPLAAACRIVEQQLISYDTTTRVDKVAILGDGKLGLMIAEVLGREHVKHFGQQNSQYQPPILFGKHQHKLDLVADSGVAVMFVSECQDSTAFTGVAPDYAAKFDVVCDATGSPAGLSLAAGLCRPMGTLVLKSTCAAGEKFNAAPFVIDELKVVGSRCGPIDRALKLLPQLQVTKYITKTFPLAQADEAIQCAAEKSTMKVQVICSES